MALIAHWLACLFFGIAQNTIYSNSDNWVSSKGLQDSSIIEQYVNSLYWAITTMTSIGYGDITPKSSLERLITVFLMCVASGAYALLINNVSSIVSNFNISASEFE